MQYGSKVAAERRFAYRGGGQEIPQDASALFPDDGDQQQRGGSTVAVPDCQQVLGGGQQMPEVLWQCRGQIIADHKEQMVKSIGKDNRTSLVSSLMAPTDAQQKQQTLLADLGKGISWLNMYKMTAKACAATS